MRKQLSVQLLTQMQLMCATFNMARRTLRDLIPDTKFQVEFPTIENKSTEQYLDADLEQSAEHQHYLRPMHENFRYPINQQAHGGCD